MSKTWHRMMIILLLLLMLSAGNTALRIDPKSYVPFLSDVHKYYRSTGIILLYDDNSERFGSEERIGLLVKGFSMLGIVSQAIGYSWINDKSAYYVSLKVRSLFVVLLGSAENLANFRSATSLHDMSHHLWLVLFLDSGINDACARPSGNPFNLVFNSRVVVRCLGERPTLSRWYSLFDNRTEVLRVPDAPAVNRPHDDAHYDALYNLQGKTIRVAQFTKRTSKMNSKMAGFFGELLDELRKFMNFSVAIEREEDAFGSYDDNKAEWSGLISFLTNRQVDLLAAPTSFSQFRLNFLEFTKPLITSRNGIYIRRPDGNLIQWTAYFRAFSIPAWSCMAIMLVLVSLTTAFLNYILSKPNLTKVSFNYTVENFINIWGIYCQQGLPIEFPTSTPLRLAYFSMLILALVISAIYSASITSYLTVLTPSLPFTDIKGFVRDGSYKVIVLQNSSDYGYILYKVNPVLGSLLPLLENTKNLPTNPFEGFQQVCNTRVGFYTSEASFDGVSGYIPCKLSFIETGQYECLAMALNKGSPYITSINYSLRKLEDNGVIKKLKNWYFRKFNRDAEMSNSAIGFASVIPLFTIFTGGFILSLFILFIEKIVYVKEGK